MIAFLANHACTFLQPFEGRGAKQKDADNYISGNVACTDFRT